MFLRFGLQYDWCCPFHTAVLLSHPIILETGDMGNYRNNSVAIRSCLSLCALDSYSIPHSSKLLHSLRPAGPEAATAGNRVDISKKHP